MVQEAEKQQFQVDILIGRSDASGVESSVDKIADFLKIIFKHTRGPQPPKREASPSQLIGNPIQRFEIFCNSNTTAIVGLHDA